MLGMSNFSKNGCVFGDVSTGVDVEGPATERGTRCSVGNATGRVSIWLGSGVCDAAHTATVLERSIISSSSLGTGQVASLSALYGLDIIS